MTVLADRYELGASLGAGGMASVIAAHDRLLDRPVAVKLLDRTADVIARQRFLREARAAARLHHPNAVQMFDTGEHDGRPYLVMERVRGPTAFALLRDGHRFEIEEAVAITAGVLDALAAAHRVGILHRDVKPANVLLPDDGGVKLADFGIAKAMGDATPGLTETGEVLGTPAYLAPEVVEGIAASPASDLYSTGCLLFELLTGAPPFEGDAAISVAYAHARTPAPLVTDRRADVPADVALVVQRALAKDPNERFTDASEMSHALLEGPGSEPLQVTVPQAIGTQWPPGDAGMDSGTRPAESAPDDAGRSWAWLLAAAALAIVAVIAIVLLRAQDGEVAGEEPGGQAQPDVSGADTDAPEQDEAGGDPTSGGPPEDGDADEAPGADEPSGPDGLGELTGRLASAPEGGFGEKQDQLLDGLRDVVRERDPQDRVEEARKLRDELAKWVEEGEIDPDVAAEADDLLAPIEGEG